MRFVLHAVHKYICDYVSNSGLCVGALYVFSAFNASLHIKDNSNLISTFSLYRAVNTPRVGYENQSINSVWENNRCLFWDSRKTNVFCEQNVQFLHVKLGAT
jgi:hypothetical protein